MSGYQPTDFDFSGSTLDSNRYKLLNVIASGGFGRVYKAVDTSLPGSPVHVAIKCIAVPEPGSLREEFLLREMMLHQDVSSHPNIIWMVLDFCDGGDLITPMAAGRFYNNEVLVKRTIDALRYCHKKNVQHQDLTIANRNCDIGCGSTEYLSPEALGTETKSRPFSTVHSDIWSVGIILVNLLTGHSPWRMATRTDVQFASFIKDPDFLYKTLSISEGVSDILRPVLAMNPLARTSLSELRRQILAVDTFWKTDVDPRTIRPYSPAPGQPRINLDSTTITPTKEIQVPDMSAGQDILLKSREPRKISSRRARFLKRTVKTITHLSIF
ncbi:kinase-like domain-containing protein [Mycena floridula]|nr:kinase-like domain-containing protein [Mycena floridula]